MRKYVCVRQHDITDCGAACLATVARHYGLKYPVTRIREMAGTDKEGTNAYGLVKAARELGFEAKGVKAGKEDLLAGVELPAIAHVIMDRKLLHYVVIHSVNEQHILVADPARGIIKYKHEDFLGIWTGRLIVLSPTEVFKPRDETTSVFSRFIALLKPYKKLLASIFIVSLMYTALGITTSFYFKILLDDIIKRNLRETLHIVSIAVIGLSIFQIISNTVRNHLLLHLSQRMDANLILGYYTHVLKLPVSFFSSRKTGDIIARFMDASKVREAVSGATLTIMIDTLMATAGAVILYLQNAWLFLITVIIVAVYAVIVFLFNTPLRNINRVQMEENAQLTSFLVESLKGIETVKSLNAEEKAVKETEKRFLALLESVFRGSWMNNLLSTLTGGVSVVGGVVILWAGAYQVLQGEMSVGQLITFNALLVYFLTPIKNLINLQSTMQTVIVALERLGEILDLTPEKDREPAREMPTYSFQGDIEFKEVDFRYGTRRLVLKGIDLDIQKGQTVALVGESGSGKTTLAKLLVNFYDWEKGEITVDRKSIRSMDLECLRQRIVYIPQEVFLFSGTVKENLCFGVEGVDMQEIQVAAEIAQAHGFIEALPLKYDTFLEENGSNLSGGQRQRLAIARAMLKKPNVLIMDEATSNLDSMTERAIERTIEHLGSEVTTIIIAHRLSTVMRCDQIFVMDQGVVVERGTHEELMRLKGTYYQLWKEQLVSEC